MSQDLVVHAPCPVVVVRGGPDVIDSAGPSLSEPSTAAEQPVPFGQRSER